MRENLPYGKHIKFYENWQIRKKTLFFFIEAVLCLHPRHADCDIVASRIQQYTRGKGNVNG